jgi:hypothetical protein
MQVNLILNTLNGEINLRYVYMYVYINQIIEI